jgi:hypothetical protein
MVIYIRRAHTSVLKLWPYREASLKFCLGVLRGDSITIRASFPTVPVGQDRGFVFPLDGTGAHGVPCLDSPTACVEYSEQLVEGVEGISSREPLFVVPTSTLQAQIY